MPIKRVTITVKPDILRKLDTMVDGRNVKNRSHAVEQLILRGMTKTDLTTAVIMAGGDGAKLRPITYEIPKALIPIKGRPVLEHQINMLKRYDIRNLIIAVGQNYEKIFEYFGNGSKFGINIEYIIEKKPLGSIGAIGLLKDKLKETFAVLNVDTLINPDIAGVYNFHKNRSALATVLLANVEDPRDFGVVRMSGDKIIDFVDRPEKAPSHIVDASFYIFEPDIIKFIKEGKFMMLKQLFKLLVKEGLLAGFVYDGYLFDVATPYGYEKAIKEWKA